MALRYNINIIGGSHPTRMEDGDIQNVAYVCLRDGSVHEQEKIHPTPNEVYWWNIEGGDSIDAIETDCGPIGVLICYDAEFPELARRLVDEGARIIFVPFCTDSRQGYLRVRYCAQARAIENQCYRRHVRQRRQPAERRQHGHPVRPELHPHALRLPLRARRHCRRGHRERRDADADDVRRAGDPRRGGHRHSGLFARFRITPVIGFILIGLLVGPYGLGGMVFEYPGSAYWVTITDPERLEPFAEFGIILLLFAIGLELSFNRLWAMRGWSSGSARSN
jgi:hypothetical protein